MRIQNLPFLLAVSLLVLASCHVPQNQKYEVLRPKFVAPELNLEKFVPPKKFKNLNLKSPPPQKTPPAQYKGLTIRETQNNARASFSPLLAGTEIFIQVAGEADLTGIYTLSESGTVRFPLVGEITLQGLTIEAAQSLITAKLKEGYILKPWVAITPVSICTNTQLLGGSEG